MLSDIDENEREIATRVQRAIRGEFQRVRDDVTREPTVAPVAFGRPWRLMLVPAVAVGVAVLVGVFAVVFASRSDEHDEIDRRIETVPGAEQVYFLPVGLPTEFVLEHVYGSRAPEPVVSIPSSRVRSYREPGTDRFLVITTTVGGSVQPPPLGWPGVSTITIAGTSATLQVTPGSDVTWVSINLACGGVTAVGRYLDATQTVAALATLHCVDSALGAAAAIDPPPPFELVLDDVTPPAWARERTTLDYRFLRTAGLGFVALSFVEGSIDPNWQWFASTDASRIREVSRGARVYSLIESQSMVNGVPRMDHRYALMFNEDGGHVMLYTTGMTLDDALVLADSVRRVGEPEFQAVLDALAVAWRKDVYAVTDVVPDGFTVRTAEDRQRASISLGSGVAGTNYSLEFRRGPDFSATMPGREGTIVTVGDRTVRLVTFGMAAPPAQVGDPVTSEVTLRQVVWSENGITVTLTTSGGPEVEQTLLAIIGGVRIVDEAEWRSFVARNKGPS